MKGQTKHDEDICLNIYVAFSRAFYSTDLFIVLPPASEIQIMDIPVVKSPGAEGILIERMYLHEIHSSTDMYSGTYWESENRINCMKVVQEKQCGQFVIFQFHHLTKASTLIILGASFSSDFRTCYFSNFQKAKKQPRALTREHNYNPRLSIALKGNG